MIALVVLSAIMGATLSVLRNQSSSFRTAGDRLELFQNMRYATTTIDRLLRTTGAGVASQQPMFIYGGNDVVAFNADHTSVLQTGCSVNVNPDAPAGSHEVMTMAQAYILPNTAFTYPTANYPTATGTSCDAETIVLYFRPDCTTADDVTDFMLLQRVNAGPPEMVARNLFAYPGRPFFEYFVHPRTLPVPPATRDSLVQANLGWQWGSPPHPPSRLDSRERNGQRGRPVQLLPGRQRQGRADQRSGEQRPARRQPPRDRTSRPSPACPTTAWSR